jgi:hypothetical protein
VVVVVEVIMGVTVSIYGEGMKRERERVEFKWSVGAKESPRVFWGVCI